MGTVNYFYLIYGIVLFFAWRLIHHFNFLKRRPYPKPGGSSAVFFVVGSGYFLALINIFQNVDFSYGFDNLILIPTILMIVAILNFWGESFIAPTKNYLISLGIGTLIGTVAYFILQYGILSSGLHSSYLELIPILVGLPIGAIAGTLIHFFVIKRRFPDWNTPLWQINKLWDKINHIAFLLFFATIGFIEATLQLRSDSLFYLFTSF